MKMEHDSMKQKLEDQDLRQTWQRNRNNQLAGTQIRSKTELFLRSRCIQRYLIPRRYELVARGTKQCSRCECYNPLVKECLFLAKDTLEENKATQAKSTTTGNNAKAMWKLEKWFERGKEGCNLFQRKACNLGEGCKRAHVCKTCRGNHPQADCTHNTWTKFSF